MGVRNTLWMDTTEARLQDTRLGLIMVLANAGGICRKGGREEGC